MGWADLVCLSQRGISVRKVNGFLLGDANCAQNSKFDLESPLTEFRFFTYLMSCNLTGKMWFMLKIFKWELYII